MRILQFINALTWGGAQTLLLDLCRGFRAAGHEVRVATFRDGPIGERLRADGVPVVLLPEAACDLAGIARLRTEMAEFRPHLIHTHLFRATFWGRLACRTLSGGDIHPPPLLTSIHGHETPVYHRLEHAMAARSARLIFPSNHLADWYESEIRPIPAHRRVIIPPGVEILDRQPSPQTASTRAVRLCALARLHPVKGLDTLLEACAILRRQEVSFRLTIGGGGRELEFLRDLSRKLGLSETVEFAGPVASPKDFLENHDLFISPSREEAFGITVCEAMERGRPVVASAIGGHREIIRPGIDGELTPADAPAELAAMLAGLIVDPLRRQRLGQAARQRVVSTYPRGAAVQAHLRLYQRVTDQSAKTREPETRPRRLLVAISSGELGGGERMALALSKALSEGLPRNRWTASFLCGPGPFAEAARRLGLPARVAPLRAGGLFFGLALLAEIRRRRPEVLHTHLNKAALFASLFRFLHRCPVVAHVHGLNRKLYYRFCDRVIAVSEAVARHLREQGLDPDRLITLPNALPPDAPAASDAKKPDHLAAQATLPDEGRPWVIGIVAKLHANKGHRWALQALAGATAARSLPPFEIRCFGDGPEEAALRREFDHGPLAGRLHWMGFRHDLPASLPELQIALLPSLGEGIPLSLLEAMRRGIPSLATAVGGIPEIVTAGENGLLVPPGDGEALLTALRALLDREAWTGYSRRARAAFARLNDFPGLVSRLDRELLSLVRDSSRLP